MNLISSCLDDVDIHFQLQLSQQKQQQQMQLLRVVINFLTAAAR